MGLVLRVGFGLRGCRLVCVEVQLLRLWVGEVQSSRFVGLLCGCCVGPASYIADKRFRRAQ